MKVKTLNGRPAIVLSSVEARRLEQAACDLDQMGWLLRNVEPAGPTAAAAADDIRRLMAHPHITCPCAAGDEGDAAEVEAEAAPEAGGEVKPAA